MQELIHQGRDSYSGFASGSQRGLVLCHAQADTNKEDGDFLGDLATRLIEFKKAHDAQSLHHLSDKALKLEVEDKVNTLPYSSLSPGYNASSSITSGTY